MSQKLIRAFWGDGSGGEAKEYLDYELYFAYIELEVTLRQSSYYVKQAIPGLELSSYLDDN